MSNPKISVIIPVYNAEKYLIKCLESIIRQTIGMSNLEIIIVNDGSTDESLQIIEKYKQKYSNIVLLNQENMGLGAARNNALELTTGEYIAFIDSDDHLPKDAYLNLYNAAENGSIDIVAGKLACIFEDSSLNDVKLNKLFSNNEDAILLNDKSEIRFIEFIKHCQVVHKICKRELIMENDLRFPENMLIEDIPFTTPLYMLAKSIKVINKVVYNYIRHENSIVGIYKMNKRLYTDAFKSINTSYENIKKCNLGEYKYILDITTLAHHFVTMDRINELLSRVCIEKYGLSGDEFKYVNEIVKDIADNIENEAILRLDSDNREKYDIYCKKLEYNQKWGYIGNEDCKESGKDITAIGNHPKISVIIPAYNVRNTLHECLESVITQSLTEIEIICVDDGSVDDSLAILKKYENDDSRIRVFTQENKGAGAARNFAISNAEGKFIAFMDADDLYPEKDILETLYKKAIQHKVKISGGSLCKILDGNIVDALFSDEEKYVFHNEGVFLYNEYQFDYGYQRFIYEREFLSEYNIYFPDYRRYQDPPFFVKAMTCADIFYATTKVVYHYRRGKAKWDPQKTNDFVRGLIDVLELSKENKLSVLHKLTVDRFNHAPHVDIFKEGFSLNNLELLELLIKANNIIDVDMLNITDLQENERFILEPIKAILSITAESRLQQIKNERSYKIGRLITYIPRKIRGAARCIKDHGLYYTIKLAYTKICR
ncbi:MAG: glycosyltransferase [Oscillospiraceae bacterium]|jgi:glycosyltransferase involved in cell wall biosynthesis|nr:glycosyltransferase [Oscillospiraceae bacterium]